ncbi:MAG TPA: CapA family protein [Kineosporiaceae bacterium]|nr:CapA family protein [Kineosporiaceae bacterium]
MPHFRPTSPTVISVLTCLVVAGCSSGTDAGSTPTVSTSLSSPSSPAQPSGSVTASPGPPDSATPTGSTPGRSFTIVATGDVLLHPPLWAQAQRDAGDSGTMDFAPMLAGVKPYVSGADLAICHLETPLANRSGPFSGYPSFSGPPQISKALKAVGYDTCSTASNHTFDQGAAGIRRTLDSLDAAGLTHTGSARTRRESRRITMVQANGVQVAFLSYAYGWNGNSYPGGDRWRANVIDKARILADARRARADGAEVVLLAMHWGTEYRQVPSAQQLDLAPELARSGVIDLIISHHAHVVEPIQRIGKTWVIYGLGNLLADHSTPGPANAEGLLARITFTRSGTGRFTASTAEYVPLLMTKAAPLRLLDVRQALRTGKYGSTTQSRLRAALARTTRVVQSMDGADHGLRPAALPRP